MPTARAYSSDSWLARRVARHDQDLAVATQRFRGRPRVRQRSASIAPFVPVHSVPGNGSSDHFALPNGCRQMAAPSIQHVRAKLARSAAGHLSESTREIGRGRISQFGRHAGNRAIRVPEQFSGSLNPCRVRHAAKAGAGSIQLTLQRSDAEVHRLGGAVDRHAAGENLRADLLKENVDHPSWRAAPPVSRHILDGDNRP